MEQVYLDIDSKGILPYDREPSMAYVFRGARLLMKRSEKDRKELSDLVRERNPKLGLVECEAPIKALEYMNRVYGCDLSWMPYFKAERFSFEEMVKSKFKVGEFLNTNINGEFVPAILVCGHVGTVGIAIHEYSHAVRNPIDFNQEMILREIFAESFRKVMTPLNHDMFCSHIADFCRARKVIRSAQGKLDRAFGNMGRYCFIRLRYDEVRKLAEDDIDEIKVREYFKGEAVGRKSSGKVRFEIMCERLGL